MYFSLTKAIQYLLSTQLDAYHSGKSVYLLTHNLVGVGNQVGIGLSYLLARLHRLAGWYDNSVPTRPFPTRFRAPIDCHKIPALETNALSSLQKLSLCVCVCVVGCSTPPPPPSYTSWFRYNLCKDDSALFSRFLHGVLSSPVQLCIF